MAYSLNKLKQELVAKRFSEDGLVAWGQNNGFGAVGALAAPMFTISRVNTKIVITPFTNREILFDRAIAYDKENVFDARISGFWIYSKLKITTKDGKVHKYSITQGKSAVKQILINLGY